jgi:hypothetical protein
MRATFIPSFFPKPPASTLAWGAPRQTPNAPNMNRRYRSEPNLQLGSDRFMFASSTSRTTGTPRLNLGAAAMRRSVQGRPDHMVLVHRSE